MCVERFKTCPSESLMEASGLVFSFGKPSGPDLARGHACRDIHVGKEFQKKTANNIRHLQDFHAATIPLSYAKALRDCRGGSVRRRELRRGWRRNQSFI